MTTIHGLDEAVRVLTRIGEEGERIASREIVAGALDVQAGAKRMTPVDTGRLRNSIAVAESEPEVAARSAAAGPQAEAPNAVRPGMLRAVIGTNVEYAREVHFGTRAMGARPFLVPALEVERPKVLRRLRRALRDLERGP